MNVIAKTSCYFSTVSLHQIAKKYLNTVIYNNPVLLCIKTKQFDIIERCSMSTYTAVTHFQKTVRFFGTPCISTH